MALLLGVAALPACAASSRAPASAAPRFLSPQRQALLGAVTDTILPQTDTPGALAADVPARLDAMLAQWASEETRSMVVDALDRIDAAALVQHDAGFASLTPADRAALLGPHDIAALKNVPPPPGAPKQHVFAAIAYVADRGYLKIKELTIELYYYSPVGSANELVYEHVPGEWQPSVRLTPQSRPSLGPGSLL